jgi:MinD-like ATPase involved in chromosome partitioning or flagellar assembly
MPAGVGATLPVLVAAAGEPWEARALELVERRGTGLALQRRCVDLHDLVATARTGLARAAVVAAGLPGLDADTVDALRRVGVATVVVMPERADDADRARMERLGAHVLDAGLEGLAEALAHVDVDPDDVAAADTGFAAEPPGSTAPGRLLAVWGPAGAPGRTTVATGVAAELAHRGRATFLVDADPYGGAVAQHLGVLDEVSGLLAAARAANAGRLDAAVLAAMARTVGGDGLRVLTGLPRPDRWSEVRAAAFDDVLGAAQALASEVVLDLGFSLEADVADPFGTAPQRNQMTLAGLERADLVLVVGSADPVGLARLARGLVDLRDREPSAAVHVVVNRSRASLGWTEAEVAGMVEGFVGPVPVSFLPDDRAAADRALMNGRSLVELGDSGLRRGVAGLVDTLLGSRPAGGRAGGRGVGLRRRRAGRAR